MVCRSIEDLTDAQQHPLGLKTQPTHQFVNGATEAKLGSSLAWAVSAIVLALSLVGVLNTMLKSVSERTREFGVLRAIGWRRSRMVRMVLGESMMLGVAGAILGGGAAWAWSACSADGGGLAC
ncbi:MAG: ABC transporter permease [Pirellulales bacterium]|nr:ABC transporter permease [Pirellulales bacterium]